MHQTPESGLGASAMPNILVLIADQLAPRALPFHGDPSTIAPTMSGLAETGVVFDAAYTGSPLCAPARASLMTGELPSRTGAFDNAASFSSELPTFAHYLRRAGYRTALSGKMHFCGPDQLHGFEERLTTDIYPADFGWTPDWRAPQERPHWYHDMSSVIDAGPCVRSNQLDFDDEVGFAARRWLFEHVRSTDERPFCLVASFTHPHDPYTISQEWWDLYDGEEIPMPTYGYDASSSTPHEQRLRQVCAIDQQPITDEQVQAALRAYRGAISYVDDQMAGLIGVLRETGTFADTVIVLTSDHGDMHGERGLWYKMSFFEGSVRVPLVVSAPGRFRPARVATPVSTVDLMPTLVAIASDQDGSPSVPDDCDGRNLLPLLTGASKTREPVLAEYLAEGAVAPIVMVRRDRLKLVRSPVDPDQLYDVETDPLERTNLTGDPAYADAYAELSADVAARWDLEQLDRQVRASQQRRLVVVDALARGDVQPAWDYTPEYDASRRYIRNHLDLGELEKAARFPPVRRHGDADD